VTAVKSLPCSQSSCLVMRSAIVFSAKLPS